MDISPLKRSIWSTGPEWIGNVKSGIQAGYQFEVGFQLE
jgi:hypothetical protein